MNSPLSEREKLIAKARLEAARRWPSYRAVGFSGAEDRQAAFVAGVEWLQGEEREAESEDHAATVVPIMQCSDGLCPSGCSHLMWSCAKCSCEGGWGAEREKLEALAASHVCPEDYAATVTGDREKLAETLWNFPENVIGLNELNRLADIERGDYCEVRDYLYEQVDAVLSAGFALAAPVNACGSHRPVQHRDAKEPWCKACGLTGDGREPNSRLRGGRRE